MPNTNVITPAQAIAQGSSSSDLMTIANGLERLAKDYLVAAAAIDSSSYQNREIRRDLKAQADANTQNAASLRRVAKAVRNAPQRVQRVVEAIEAELPMSQRLK